MLEISVFVDQLNLDYLSFSQVTLIISLLLYCYLSCPVNSHTRYRVDRDLQVVLLPQREHRQIFVVMRVPMVVCRGINHLT